MFNAILLFLLVNAAFTVLIIAFFKNKKVLLMLLALFVVFILCYVYVLFFSWRTAGQEKKFAGRYQAVTGEYIELDKTHKWEATPGLFNCNTGTWEYSMTEDRNFMELTCEGAQVSFIQIMNCSEHQMEFIPGTGKLPLRFEKVN